MTSFIATAHTTKCTQSACNCPDRKSCIIETALKELEKEGDRKDVAIYSVKTGKGETPLLVRSPFFNKSEVER